MYLGPVGANYRKLIAVVIKDHSMRSMIANKTGAGASHWVPFSVVESNIGELYGVAEISDFKKHL